jgi:hypothetical protein
MVWGSLVFIVAASTAVYFLSSSPTIASITLVPNESIDLSVFRPLAHGMNLSLGFEKHREQKRPELGDQAHRGDWRKNGFVEVVDPGLPVKLLVRGKGKNVIYEAMPANWQGGTTAWRILLPYVDDGNPNRFPWPPDLTLRHELPPGYSHFIITVQEVGDQLIGEKTRIMIEPPVSFKSHAPGYGYIWWFEFWWLYAAVLLIYGFVLLWCSFCRGKLKQ